MIEQSQFAEFFQELTGFEPFNWQQSLAERVLTTGWPKWLALPTGAGKTMVLPVAIFEAAYRAQRGERVPRRFSMWWTGALWWIPVMTWLSASQGSYRKP